MRFQILMIKTILNSQREWWEVKTASLIRAKERSVHCGVGICNPWRRGGCLPGVNLGVLGVSLKGLPQLSAQFQNSCKGVLHYLFQKKALSLNAITRGNYYWLCVILGLNSISGITHDFYPGISFSGVVSSDRSPFSFSWESLMCGASTSAQRAFKSGFCVVLPESACLAFVLFFHGPPCGQALICPSSASVTGSAESPCPSPEVCSHLAPAPWKTRHRMCHRSSVWNRNSGGCWQVEEWPGNQSHQRRERGWCVPKRGLVLLLPLGLGWVVNYTEGAGLAFLQGSRFLRAWGRKLSKKMNTKWSLSNSEGAGALKVPRVSHSRATLLSSRIHQSHSTFLRLCSPFWTISKKIPVTPPFAKSLDWLQKGTSKWWHRWGWIPAAQAPDVSVPNGWPLPQKPLMLYMSQPQTPSGGSSSPGSWVPKLYCLT